MGHFELGPDRPATGFLGALQIRHSQEDMTPFASTNTHLAVAMRTDQLIRTHGKYLQRLEQCVVCKINRLSVSVFITVQKGLFVASCFIPKYPQNAGFLLLIISLSLGNDAKTVMDIHNE